MDTSQIFIILVLGFGLIVAALIALSGIEARKRTAALKTTAQEMGFAFFGDTWNDQPKAHQFGTALFDKGSRRRFKNAMVGTTAGLRTNVFDYSYTISDGESSRIYTQTVAAFSQASWLPKFELRPEGFLDRVTEAFVHHDINFDSYPEFSRRYFLRDIDEDGIRRLFSESVITFLNQISTDEKWHVEGNLATLVIYRRDTTVSPGDLQSFLDKTTVIAAEFFQSPGMMKPVR